MSKRNPFLFDIGENRESTVIKTLVHIRRHSLSPGQLLRLRVEKAGNPREEDLGGQAFRSSRRSKWLFRGQESRRELKIRAIGHEGEAVEEDGRAPILSPGTSRHRPRRRRRRRCSTPIRVELCRRSPSFLFSPSPLSLFATHATLARDLSILVPSKGGGFLSFRSLATVTSTLSISPKADANEHMEVTWKYDVDVARRENGKGDGKGCVKKAVTVTWI